MGENLPAVPENTGYGDGTGYGSSDLLPARREPSPVARSMTDMDSWTTVIRDVVTLSEHVADTAFVPKGLRGSAPAVAACILAGREIGLGPMASLQNVHVIEGTPTLRAEHMRAQVLAAGHELWYPELGGGRVIAAGKRRGSQREVRIEWSIDMAKAAGLLGKNNWKSYPRQMLTARATAELCRVLFPDVTHGLYATEEVEDDGAPGAGDQPGSESRPATSGAGGTRTVARKGASKRAASKGGGGGGAERPQETPPPPPVPEAPVVAEPAAEVPLPPAPLPAGPGQPVGAPPLSAGDGSPDDVAATGTDEEYERLKAAGAYNRSMPGPVKRCELSGEHEQHTWSAFTGDGTVYLCPGEGEEQQTSWALDVEPEDRVRMADQQQVRYLNIRLTGLDVKERAAKLYVIGALVGREVESSKDLTSEECDDLIDALKAAESREQLTAMVDEAVRERAGGGGDGTPAS